MQSNMNNNTIKHIFLAFALAGAASGCGSPPIIKNSKVAAHVQKISSLHFVYRQSGLHASSPSTKTAALESDAGLEHFGFVLVGRAKEVFAKHGVSVLSAHRISDKEPSTIKKAASSVAAARQPVLRIHAIQRPATDSQHAAGNDFTFAAQLIDTVSKKTVWSATLDTDAWSGKDHIAKSVSKSSHDDTYADELLKVIIEQMKSDGIVG